MNMLPWSKFFTKWHAALSMLVPAALFLAIVAMGCLFTTFCPRIFQSEALVWIQPRLPVESGQPHVYYPLGYSSVSPDNTACELLKSSQLASQAIDSVKSKLPPSRIPTVKDFLTNLRVKPTDNIRDSNLIELQFRSGDAKESQLLLQGLLNAFLEFNNSQMTVISGRSQKQVEDQLAAAQSRCDSDKKALDEFQSENGALNLPGQVEGMIAKETRLTGKVEDSKLRIADLKAKIDAIQSRLYITPDLQDAASRVQSDEVIKKLKSLIADEELAILQDSAKFRKELPRTKRIKRTVERNKAALVDRARDIAGESGVRVVEGQMNASDPVQQRLAEQFADTSFELAAEESNLAKWTSSVAEIRYQLQNMPALKQRGDELAQKAKGTAREVEDLKSKVASTKASQATSKGANNIRVVDPPSLPDEAIFPSVKLCLLITLVLATAIAGVGYFVVRHLLNPFVSSTSELRLALGLPVLGWIASRQDQTPLTDLSQAMLQLRLNWKELRTDGKKTIVVLSTDEFEGQATVAGAIAESFALSGARVVLVDADFWSSSLCSVFKVPKSPGLCEYLASSDANLLTKVIRPVRTNLGVIPAGDPQANSTDLQAATFRRLLAHLENETDVVVLNVPPISKTPEALALLNQDVYLLVVAALKETQIDSLSVSAVQLEHQQFKSGAVFLFGASASDFTAARTQTAGIEEPIEVMI